MKELLSLLHKIHPLSPALKKYIAEHLQQSAVRRKAFLLNAGDINQHVYFIKTGLLRCFYIDNHKEVCCKFMKEGDMIASASSFFRQESSHEFIQALEESTVWYISYEELQYMYTHFHEFNTIGRVLTTRSFLQSEQRLHFIRMRRAADRYQSMLHFFPELVLRVPAKHIASYLGISVETLSRTRKKRLDKTTDNR